MNCDMCANKQGPFYKGDVEGATMTLCQECKSAAQKPELIIIAQEEQHTRQTQSQRNTREPEHKEIIQIIATNYGSRIQQARTKQGLKQEELAKKLAEKTSLLAAMENNKHEPGIELARKLERTLGIRLVEQHQETSMKHNTTNTGELTIADMIRKR